MKKSKWGGKGEQSRTAKLTQAKVDRIRDLHDNGNYSHQELADMFEVSRSAITSIISRRYWNE